jgi:hypothetical protein
MNRRAFLQLTGTAVTAGLGPRHGGAEPGPDTAALLSLLEDSPRGQLPAQLVGASMAYLPNAAVREAVERLRG